jgi:elongation factor Ts
MAEISAEVVKALREQTGQGMMECKKALQESGGDVELAKDLLRKKGLMTAEKKASRATGEGLIGVHMNAEKTSAAMVEVRCETDFCARNDVFRAMVAKVAELAAAGPDGPVEPTATMKQAVQDALTKIGENIVCARSVKISASRVGAYIHHNGKVGVLVGVDGPIDETTLADLCMHIAFADPMGIAPADVPVKLVAKERQIAAEQAAASGKPANIVEKMVEGKVAKFLAANALQEQPFIRDDKKKVKDILGAAKVKAFARFAVGQ